MVSPQPFFEIIWPECTLFPLHRSWQQQGCTRNTQTYSHEQCYISSIIDLDCFFLLPNFGWNIYLLVNALLFFSMHPFCIKGFHTPMMALGIRYQPTDKLYKMGIFKNMFIFQDQGIAGNGSIYFSSLYTVKNEYLCGINSLCSWIIPSCHQCHLTDSRENCIPGCIHPMT